MLAMGEVEEGQTWFLRMDDAVADERELGSAFDPDDGEK